MQGSAPTINDIELDLHETVCPVALECSEILSLDEASPEVDPYKICGACYVCGAKLRLFAVATPEGIRGLQHLLLESLSLLCTNCGKETF